MYLLFWLLKKAGTFLVASSRFLFLSHFTFWWKKMMNITNRIVIHLQSLGYMFHFWSRVMLTWLEAYSLLSAFSGNQLKNFLPPIASPFVCWITTWKYSYINRRTIKSYYCISIDCSMVCYRYAVAAETDQQLIRRFLVSWFTEIVSHTIHVTWKAIKCIFLFAFCCDSASDLHLWVRNWHFSKPCQVLIFKYCEESVSLIILWTS